MHFFLFLPHHTYAHIYVYINRTIGRTMLRLIVRSIVACNDWLYHRSSGATIDRMLGHRISQVLVWSVTVCHDCSYDRSQVATIDWSYHRSPAVTVDRFSVVDIIATTSHTISCDGSCHRYSPIVRDSATTRRARSRYATTVAEDRNKNCRPVAPWPNRNQSYDGVIGWGGYSNSEYRMGYVARTQWSVVIQENAEPTEGQDTLKPKPYEPKYG